MAAADADQTVDTVTSQSPLPAVGETEESEVRTDLGQVDYLAIGHISIDIFEKRYVLGGTVSFAALTARQLGQTVGLLTSADFEPLIVDSLVGRENVLEPVTPIRVLRVPTDSTTCYVNEYDEHGRTQYLLGRAADLLPVHVPEEWKSAPVVHLAPLAQEIDPALLSTFPSSLLVITPQGWMRGWDKEGKVFPVTWEYARQAFARADAVVFSTDDVPVPALVAEYASMAKLMVVTEHRRGCLVYEKGKAPWRSHAFRAAREVDPTGAGDVFAAAFATRYHQTGNPRASADFANAAASFVLEKRGAQAIPTAEAVADRLKRGKRRGA